MADDETTTPPDTYRDSFLGRIRSRREEIRAAQWVELPVPRWDNPRIWVRYGPLEHSVIRAEMQHARKAQDKAAAELRGNENILVKACLGVFAVDGDDGDTLAEDTPRLSLHPAGEDHAWTRFDDDLAESMGLPRDSTARAVLRTIYFEDGDVFNHSNRVVRFSGYESQEGDRELLGE